MSYNKKVIFKIKRTFDDLDIYNFLNVKYSLRKLSDKDFEIFLPIFINKLLEYGFDNIVTYYNNGLTLETLDWLNLKKKYIDKDWINSTSVVGTNIIKRHMLHIYEVRNYKGFNIKGKWEKKSLEKALRANRKSHSTPYISEIIRQLGFTAGTSKVTIYRPLLTKRIVETLNAKNVLDVCVGWGGRMLGSSCIEGVSYTGIEPFSKTYDALVNIKNILGLENVSLYNGPAETILEHLERKYDLAITSPPYYNLEIYSDEPTQSHYYGTYEEWILRFLRPVVYGVLDKLVENGYSCWSVKNFKTDKVYNLYDDIVKLHTDKGWVQIDREFYVGNNVRPGNDKKGKEITYVFVKNK